MRKSLTVCDTVPEISPIRYSACYNRVKYETLSTTMSLQYFKRILERGCINFSDPKVNLVYKTPS